MFGRPKVYFLWPNRHNKYTWMRLNSVTKPDICTEYDEFHEEVESSEPEVTAVEVFSIVVQQFLSHSSRRIWMILSGFRDLSLSKEVAEILASRFKSKFPWNWSFNNILPGEKKDLLPYFCQQELIIAITLQGFGWKWECHIVNLAGGAYKMCVATQRYQICISPEARLGGRGGKWPGAALLVKSRNSKLSFPNEPEVRFRFYILVKVGPTICLAGTVSV